MNNNTAILRYYYSDTVHDFLQKSQDSILGILASKSPFADNDETKDSWIEEIQILKEVLNEYDGRGSVYFEYSIPRIGARADVIAFIDNIVFVLEFKTGKHKFTHAATLQAWDYALDLKNFHDGSRDLSIVPILVAPSENDKNCELTLEHFNEKVYKPFKCNRSKLNKLLKDVIEELQPDTCIESEWWAHSGYNPSPTIIEAARALYQHHRVEEITRHDADLKSTVDCVDKIITKCKTEHRKAICFVTGVPGAGKTLIGLQTAITYGGEEENKEAVYLSGNFPLVEVLQESLARDFIARKTEEYNVKVANAKKNGEDVKAIEKPISKKKAKSDVKKFIQMVHQYRDDYMNGMKVKGKHLVRDEKFFKNTTDSAYIPKEHIAIFDEAQRAWTQHGLADFMLKKKKVAKFPYSEPYYLLSCMDRHEDWCVVICLVGGGQEIHHDEAGISEWIDALNKGFKSWDIYMSQQLKEYEYAQGKALKKVKPQERLQTTSALHLTSSMRSYRGPHLSMFIHQLLDLKPKEARRTLQELENYPLVITRSLDTAKKWLKDHAGGSERYGIIASSRAERLKAININVRYQPDFVHWFLDDDTDIRSSNSLEDTLTEFKVQGLEIDWACVVWDADMRLSDDKKSWKHYKLSSSQATVGGLPVNKCRWNNIKKKEIQEFQKNAYRVLLTRARQGMVIVVPNGDNGVPPDETRKPEWYDGIYNYLKDLGLIEI